MVNHLTVDKFNELMKKSIKEDEKILRALAS